MIADAVMSDIAVTSPLFSMAQGVVAGLILGGLFFGGLWLTVQRVTQLERPAGWFALSALLRLGLLCAGLWFIGHAAPLRLVGALVGFIAARVLSLRYLGAARAPSSDPYVGEGHGSQS